MRKLMQNIIDIILPRNCRKELKRAAERNHATIEAALRLLQHHHDDITQAIKHDRRSHHR